MTTSGWIWRGLLALAGCIVSAYVFEEVIGGGAIGYTVCGAILGATVGPLMASVLAWRKAKDDASAAEKQKGGSA